MHFITTSLVTLSLFVSLALSDSVSETCNDQGCELIKTFSDGRENEYYSIDSPNASSGSGQNSDLSYVSQLQTDKQGDRRDDVGQLPVFQQSDVIRQTLVNDGPRTDGATNPDAYTDYLYGYNSQEGPAQPKQEQTRKELNGGCGKSRQVSEGYSGGGSAYDSSSNTEYGYQYANRKPKHQQQVSQQTSGEYSASSSSSGSVGQSGCARSGLGGLLRFPGQLVGSVMGSGGLSANYGGGSAGY